MVSTTLSTILFVSKGNDLASKVAEIIFLQEADRSQLAWTAVARVVDISSGTDASINIESIDDAISTQYGINREQLMIPEQMQAIDLETARLVIYLKLKGSGEKVAAQLSNAGTKLDIWELPGGEAALSTITQNISNMAIRLIMQGGRREPIVQARPESQASGSPTKSNVRVCLESKGRKGKKVTVVSGLSLADSELQKLSTKLKQFCGVGGTVKEGNVELQGDQCDRVLVELSKLGYKAKRSGAPSKK